MSGLKERFPYDIKEYAPVYNFFDFILRKDDLMFVLDLLKRNCGAGYDAVGYNLPSIFDSEDEEGFFDNGIMFWEGYDEPFGEKLIDFETFLNCLRAVCQLYLEGHPEKDKEIEADLAEIERKVKLNEYKFRGVSN